MPTKQILLRDNGCSLFLRRGEVEKLHQIIRRSPRAPKKQRKQTGELEDAAKEMTGKNAVAVFDPKYTFHWTEFIETIIEEKFRILKQYLETCEKERGKAFLYRILDLIRATWNQEEDGKINIARFAYQLARIEPEKNAAEEVKQIYQEFSKSMYQWIKNKEEAKQLEMAIYLYAYLTRDRKDD